MPTSCCYHSCWAWSGILSTQCNNFVISLQYLKKKLGREFIFCMQISIKVSTSWDYCFWWKWPDISKVPKKEVRNIFAKSVPAAFVFYCGAKHSDIFWGSSHVYCDILVSLYNQTRNFLPKDRNTIIRAHLCGEGLSSLFFLLQVDVFQ